MNPHRLLPIAVVVLAGCALAPDSATKSPPRTTVVFDHPEKFTDVKDTYIPTDEGRDTILRHFREFLVSRCDPLLPEGYKLTITFTDIKLAGEYEPWHGAQWIDVRVIKAIYPPAFTFTYTVTDPTGRPVKQGSENILDVAFQMRLLTPYDASYDPLAYEKDILNDWARTTLRGLAKA
jgi:hypothetical protein